MLHRDGLDFTHKRRCAMSWLLPAAAALMIVAGIVLMKAASSRGAPPAAPL